MKGLEKIEVEIAQLVRRTVADSLRAGGSIAKEVTAGVRDVVSGAIQATENAGTELAVKGVARGAVAGVHDVQGNVAKAAAEIVKTAMRQAHKVGADVAVVAGRAVGGIVEGVKESGGTSPKAPRERSKAPFKPAPRSANWPHRPSGKSWSGWLKAWTRSPRPDRALVRWSALPRISKPRRRATRLA